MASAKQFFLGTIAFMALALLFSPVQKAFFGLIKFVFEGNSIGKMYLFLGFVAMLFAFLWLSGRNHHRHAKEKGCLPFFIAVVGAMFVLSLALQGILLYTYGAATPGASITAFYERNGILEWGATYLQHTHTGKVSMGLISQIIPFGLEKVDSGLPMYSITPFAPVFGAIFLALMIAAIYFAFMEARRIYDGGVSPDLLVWAVLSFGMILLSMDGGILTLGSQTAIALLAYYYLRNYSGHNFSPLEQFAYPMLITGGAQFLLSFIFSSTTSSSYGLPMAGIILVLATIFNNRHGHNFNWKAWLVFGLVLVAAAGDSYIGFTFGRLLVPGKQADLFIYGLPEDLTREQLSQALSGRLEIQKIEKTGWIAMVQAVPKTFYATNLLESDLREEFKPKGYLYLIPMLRSQNLVRVQANVPIDSLLSVRSKFIEFSTNNVEGKNYITMNSKLHKVYSGLWVLNYLRYDRNIRNAVVSTS